MFSGREQSTKLNTEQEQTTTNLWCDTQLHVCIVLYVTSLHILTLQWVPLSTVWISVGTVPHSEHMHSYPVSVLPCLSYLLAFSLMILKSIQLQLCCPSRVQAFFNEDLPEIQLDIIFGDNVFDIWLSPQELSEFSSLSIEETLYRICR